MSVLRLTMLTRMTRKWIFFMTDKAMDSVIQGKGSWEMDGILKGIKMRHCQAFIKPVTKTEKGCQKPIFSKNFQDRFQIDPIDFRKLRKRDPFGVLMRWKMTLKDHAIGLIHICALPRKRPDLIAYKLQEIFGLIEYPKIFHTDNGKQFTAKLVLQFFWQLNPSIVDVTGRPRRPQDQGSVENANATVKRVSGSVLTERRLAGENPFWTEVLGSIAAVLNLQSG